MWPVSGDTQRSSRTRWPAMQRRPLVNLMRSDASDIEAVRVECRGV